MKKYDYEEELLKNVLNDLDIPEADETTVKKMADIMHRGIMYLEDKYSNTINFDEQMEARELLFAYCRYGRSNAIEQFEKDFKSSIVHFSIDGAIKAKKESEGAEDEI